MHNFDKIMHLLSLMLQSNELCRKTISPQKNRKDSKKYLNQKMAHITVIYCEKKY
jgi:hypothetical protein